MPLPQNFHAIVGAGLLGIVCAATLYMVEHRRQDRRRLALVRDLARINNELALLRNELDTLLAQEKRSKPPVKRVSRGGKLSTSSTDEYSSALDNDSSDLEFFDVSDDEPERLYDFTKIDRTLDLGEPEELESCIRLLQTFSRESPNNPEIFWRLGKAFYRKYEKTDNSENLNIGIDICGRALQLQPELANVHKWYAILVGSRTRTQPIKQKILDGHVFKQHVDAAVRLDPRDPFLHHMLGRFAYDIAELKWYERKLAATLFAEPPTGTYEEALRHFLEAGKLQTDKWKENMVFVGKCRIKLGQVDLGVKVLKEAERLATSSGVDQLIDQEIKELLQKHKR